MSNSNNGRQGRSPGPNVALPSTLTLSSFTTARLKEIQMMRKYMSESTSTKMAFQKLPKHMRRRAMSHVVKRLPRRLREIHANQMKKSGLPPRSKRPTRKHRRRPLNLQQDYIRRQRRIKWLDTHIWHAKRFHMIEKWGYKLPKQPCDKSFKACYRATTQHCLLQDLSYMRCIEIGGLYNDIVTELQRITDPKVGLTFKAKCFSEGKKFGEVMIFEPNQPGKAVGEVQFLWSKDMTNKQFLWIFVHPAFYSQFLNILLALYDVDISGDTKSEGISAHYAKNGVVIRELEYEVGKLRLTGALSTAVLTEALGAYQLNENSEKVSSWLSDWPLENLMEQNDVFTDLPHKLCLPPNMVLSVLVRDPRLNLPKQRTKALTNEIFEPSTDDEIHLFQKNVSLSPLLDDSVRRFVKDNKVSNKDICALRKECLVPGSELLMENESVIPIILLWRSGNKTVENNGYSAGWDIILPTCWIQSFFISFIMWGARAGGLRETESLAFEACKSDLLYPDTEAGFMEEDAVTQLYKNRFFRLPPNKRTNYNKFGIVSPFCFNWQMLITEWSDNTCDSFSVLRDKRLLKSIQECLSSKTILPLPSIPKNCLIPVKVVPVKKGVCTKFGLICLPLDSDKTEPVEPKRKDVLAQKRKSVRDEHRKLLQRLRKRRRRCYKLGKPVTKTDAEVLRAYTEQMRKLWLPEPETIVKSCSRTVIGFIKHGGFSFALGQSKGLGYIAAGCLDVLAKLPQRNKVLIRNSNSRQYRLAIMNVILD